jgi:CHAT domain-containing protein
MKMLTIAASQAHNQNLPRLFNVAREAECVANIAGLAGASSMHITDSDGKADVREGLQAAHMVHFACHGIQDVAKPHQSHFSLASRDLTVSELMEMDLKDAFLAFLSACETATGTQEHADEAIHLAASMLFAGFRSVVATMWLVRLQYCQSGEETVS